ncbi:hypothetical protein CBS11350_5228 [Aspergillus niger]|nr:hypothetical protein CBS11350_5228 [Aspergillus niger]
MPSRLSRRPSRIVRKFDISTKTWITSRFRSSTCPYQPMGTHYSSLNFFWPYQKPLPDPDEEIEFSPSSPKEAMRPLDEAMILSDYFGEYITDATLVHKVDWQHNPRQTIDFPCILHEIDQEKSLDWRVDGITGIPGGPRMKSLLLESVNADDDQITRGEILFSPVLLISFVGPRHARILMGHHDGTNLVIRQSKRFAFWKQNIPDWKILLRWWCSSAVGDTINGTLGVRIHSYGGVGGVVEVSASVNRYLAEENFDVVSGTWDLYARAPQAAAWMFVYPREPKLVSKYIEMYAEDENGSESSVQMIVWLGPRADWADYEPCFRNSSFSNVSIPDEVGMMEFEMLAIMRKR